MNTDSREEVTDPAEPGRTASETEENWCSRTASKFAAKISEYRINTVFW